MTQPYDTTNVNDGDSIFEDAYVYGKLYYNIDEDDITFRNVHIRENLFVGKINLIYDSRIRTPSWFNF